MTWSIQEIVYNPLTKIFFVMDVINEDEATFLMDGYPLF